MSKTEGLRMGLDVEVLHTAKAVYEQEAKRIANAAQTKKKADITRLSKQL